MIPSVIFTGTYRKDLALNIGSLEIKLRITFSPAVIKEGCYF